MATQACRSPSLLALIAEWHSMTSYIIWHDHEQIRIWHWTRSAAKDAALLQHFGPATPLPFFHTLAQRYQSSEWVQRCITMFADDLHSGQTFHTYRTACGRHHSKIWAIILDALEGMGLELALDKTFVLLHICGSNCRKTSRQQLMKRDRDGVYIEVPRHANKPVTKLRVKTASQVPWGDRQLSFTRKAHHADPTSLSKMHICQIAEMAVYQAHSSALSAPALANKCFFDP